MNDLIPIVLFVCIYLVVMEFLKGRNRIKILRILADNNVLSNSDNKTSINFKMEGLYGEKERNKNILPISLGALGFGVGLLISAIIKHILNHTYGDLGYNISGMLEVAPAIIFLSVGLLISYFIIRKEENSKK